MAISDIPHSGFVRLGRFTLRADDIIHQWLYSLNSPGRPAKVGFDLATLVLKLNHGRVEFIEGPEALVALQRIQTGWRPTSQPVPRLEERLLCCNIGVFKIPIRRRQF
jgi:hypothetical protein